MTTPDLITQLELELQDPANRKRLIDALWPYPEPKLLDAARQLVRPQLKLEGDWSYALSLSENLT